MIGVVTGGLALILVPFALILGPLDAGTHPTADVVAGMLAVAAVLGIAVSWGGTWLWNEASASLTTTLAGLLVTAETIAGYTYSYVLDSELPARGEVLGFALVIVGVALVALLPRRA